jgi:two-component system phosphate regulon response regulator OmpR
MRAGLEREPPDVVLLDLRLPGEDDLMPARYLRERYDVGIIMVTGAGAVVDRIVGLEVGADDYPANDPRELLARLKGVLRRIQAGVRALLRKPVDPAALLQTLIGCLPAAGTPVQGTTSP